jgi:hypothetical protein
MTCPHCSYTDEGRDKKVLYPERFYRLPLDMVQQDASGGTTALYACPKCCKTFIIT